MLFRQVILEAVARGDVTLAFRRRQRPTVKAGTGLHTAAGVVRIGAAEPIEEQDLNDADLARAAGVEKLRFKQDMRKQKELGLTESLDVGYRLLPRGGAVLEKLREHRL